MNQSSFSQLLYKPSEASSPGSGDTGTGIGSSIADAKESIKDTARHATEGVKAKVTDAATRLKDKASEAVEQKKQAAADRIGGYSSAVHESAKSFEEQDPNIAWFTHRAADRLQGVADYVRDGDFRTIKTDAENLARRHPVAFFGGLFVVGLIVGNLLKASEKSGEAASYDSQEGGFDEGYTDYDPAEPYPISGESEQQSSPSFPPPSSQI
jgi:hypothetical protein